MEYTYPTSNKVGRENNQLCSQSANDSFVDGYSSCMYDSPQTTANRYSVQNSQIITPIDTPICFAPPVSCFPGTAQCAIVAAENQQQLRQYILSLQKLLQNFAVYCFRCHLTIKVYGSHLGQTHVQLALRKTKKGITLYKDYTFQLHIMIKEQLKQAVLELAQPLLMNLLPCSHCNIKHYKRSCMNPFLLNTHHAN